MYISRVVISGYRNFSNLDINLAPGVTCIVGENNSGKSNFIDALRLVVDSNLSSVKRQLDIEDFPIGTNYTEPTQALVSVEFSNFAKRETEEAMLFGFLIDDDLARLTFRFRPNRKIRDEIKAGAHSGDNLSIEDYRWEISGGGDVDPAIATWADDFGKSVRFEELQQSYLVVFMEALRDVDQRLRQSKNSPLARLLTSADIPEKEQESLVTLLTKANQEISNSATIKNIGDELTTSFASAAGAAYKMGVTLGMNTATFNDVSRGLNVLLSEGPITNINTARNGLGLNNILYISMLLQYFRKRVAEAKTAGQLLIIEEPESHLHPQLQTVLYEALKAESFQTIVTTHSTHVTSHSNLDSVIVLTKEKAQTRSFTPSNASITEKERADLERYLDATKGLLLFARKAMLVEGPAELFLIPALISSVLKIDLEEVGITLIPIYGVHFSSYSKIFGEDSINRKCAIVADADMTPSDSSADSDDEEELDIKPVLIGIENKFVKLFLGKTTFEYELVDFGTLKMFEKAAEEFNAKKTLKLIKDIQDKLELGIAPELLFAELDLVRPAVLNLAKRVGKARFAQVASKYANLAEYIPPYIEEALEWLLIDAD